MEPEPNRKARWPPHPRLPGDGSAYRYRWIALIGASVGIFVLALNLSTAGIVAPHLSQAIGATASQIQWAFDAYTIVIAGLVVLGGHVAERYGRKGFMQVGLAVFALGSSVSAFAQTPLMLMAGQALAGVGAALLMPVSLAIATTIVTPEERPQAIGIYASIGAMGLASGSFLGGLLIDWFWWGAAFLISIPVTILSIVILAFFVPPSRITTSGPLDLLGALLSMIGLGGIVFGFIEGPDQGWTNPVVWIPFIAGLVCTVLFVLWELRCREPLMDVRVLRIPQVFSGALTMMMVYFSLAAIQLLVPQYLGYVLNFSSLTTGLLMFPLAFFLITLSPKSAAIQAKVGSEIFVPTLLLLMTLGCGILALLPVWGGWQTVLIGNLVYGLGIGLIVSPATSSIMIALPTEKAGDGSAVNMVSRQVGAALGVAIPGSIAAVVYRQGLTLSEFPLDDTARSEVTRSLAGVQAVQKDLDPAVASRLDAMADASMVRGVMAGQVFSAILIFGTALLVWAILRRVRMRTDTTGNAGAD